MHKSINKEIGTSLLIKLLRLYTIAGDGIVSLMNKSHILRPFVVAVIIIVFSCMKSQMIRSFFLPGFFLVRNLFVVVVVVVGVGSVRGRLPECSLFVKNTTSFRRFPAHPFVVDHAFVPSDSGSILQCQAQNFLVVADLCLGFLRRSHCHCHGCRRGRGGASRTSSFCR